MSVQGQIDDINRRLNDVQAPNDLRSEPVNPVGVTMVGVDPARNEFVSLPIPTVGEQTPPIAPAYTTQALMFADQANQKTGFIYRVGNDTFEKLATSAGVIGDYKQVNTPIDISGKLDKGTYTGTASELDSAISGAVSGFRGSLLIADTPTLDGFYTPLQSGTYTNAGNLVYSPTTTDLGFDVKFIKSGASWSKSRIDLNIQVENGVVEGSQKLVRSGDVFDALPITEFIEDNYTFFDYANLTPVNCTFDFTDGNLFLTLTSAAGWVKFPTEINNIKYKAINSGGLSVDKLILGFNTAGNPYVLYLNSSSFGKLYTINTSNTLTFIKDFFFTGQTAILANDEIDITRAEDNFNIKIKRSGQTDYVDYLNFNFITESKQLGFITQSSPGNSRKISEKNAAYNYIFLRENNQISELVSSNTTQLIKPIREVKNDDFTLNRGTSFSYQDGKLKLVGTNRPYVLLSENVRTVEFKIETNTLGILIGIGDNFNTIAATSITGSRTVSDFDATAFNIRATVMESTVPGSYGIDYMPPIAAAVVGDLIRASIIGEDRIEMQIKRVGQTEFIPYWQFDRRSLYASNNGIIGWNTRLQLGFFSFTSSNENTVAGDVKIIDEIETNYLGETQRTIQSRLNFLESRLSFSNHWTDKTWLALGDSITDQERRLGLGYQTFADQIIRFKNISTRAYSGKTIPQILLEYPNFELDTDLISFYGGVNDYLFQTPLGTENSTDTTTTSGALIKMLTDLSNDNPSATICVFTPNRIWGYDQLGTKEPETMENAGRIDTTGVVPLLDYVNRIELIARRMGFPVLNLYYNSNFNRYNIDTRTYDGLHPNKYGCEKLGRIVAHFFNSI